jgi:serine protease Do
MDSYEGFHDRNETEAAGLNGETPETVNAASVSETPVSETPVSETPVSETPVSEAPAGAAPVNEAPASEAPAAPAYELPVERRGAYSDAGYIPAADAGTMPKSYHCAAAAEPRTRKERASRRGMHPAAVVALCLVCAMLGGLVCSFAPQWMTNKPAAAVEAADGTRAVPASSGTTDTVLNLTNGDGAKTVTTNKVSSEEMSATDIYYKRALDQVVTIRVGVTYTSYFGYETKATGSGSGFIISEDGYILTNYHVIESTIGNGADVTVITNNGTEYPAAIIGYDEDHDVALLKIEATGLNAAILGDSDAMLVGEDVYVVGNPTGQLEYSMTEGIVSAKDREITAANSSTGRTETISVFQTTAAINGGNSGGPVYNSRGEVVGIVVAKRISTDIEGLAFAIPINDAVRIAQDLINDGYVRGKAYLGVRLGTVTAAAAQYYGLVQGAIVASVEPDTAAERAGLKESDIIVAIDGKEVATSDELINAKKSYSAGDSAVLKVYREGKYQEITVTFDEMVPEALNAESEDAGEEAPSEQPEQRMPGSGSDGGSYEDFFREFFGGTPFGN